MRLAGSPALPSPLIRGCPEPSDGGDGSAATVSCAIVYMSARAGKGEVGGNPRDAGFRGEKAGSSSSRRACARVPISQLEIVNYQ
jgi:hypothetical protein